MFQDRRPIEDPNEMDLPVADAARRVGLTADDLSRALASFSLASLEDVVPVGLTAPEKQALLTFLGSLSGTTLR